MEINGMANKMGFSLNDVSERHKSEELHNSGDSLANEMKEVRKARLQRQVMADPSLAGKLVATEASPMYNAKGEIIQAVSGNLGDV